MTTLDDLVPDQLWAIVEPLLPVPTRPPYGSRRRTVATVGRRLDAWAAAGVFDQLHLEVLDRLGERGEVNRMRATVDTMSVRAGIDTEQNRTTILMASVREGRRGTVAGKQADHACSGTWPRHPARPAGVRGGHRRRPGRMLKG